ncbi:MAG: hypothetical protein B6D59_03515 [Campylobacteraceae bacterium 4484_4]|nr:MAG: hypothetical protein B6D59_03515 [Campylobacteraceae bacterium 4484_4]
MVIIDPKLRDLLPVTADFAADIFTYHILHIVSGILHPLIQSDLVGFTLESAQIFLVKWDQMLQIPGLERFDQCPGDRVGSTDQHIVERALRHTADGRPLDTGLHLFDFDISSVDIARTYYPFIVGIAPKSAETARCMAVVGPAGQIDPLEFCARIGIFA